MTPLAYRRVAFLIPPTGAWCREDRCQSYFRFELIPTLRAPLEECEAAGAIRAAGARATVLDAPALGLGPEDVTARLTVLAPDLVVLVVTYGSLADDLLWAKSVREVLPGASIAVRGAPAYTRAESILEHAPDVDFCVRGDYELVFDAVVRRGYREAPGTVYRDAGRMLARPTPMAANLDDLPWPDREAIEPERYRVRGLRAPQASVRVQRGCPFPCSYCLVHSVSGDRARHRSPESVAAEIAELCARGVRYLYLRADTFSLDRAWAIETSRAIAEAAPRARWVTTTRADCVDEDVIAAMARGGCYGLSFGIDAASSTIGERVGKRPNLDAARRAMRLCDRHDIVSLGYFMLGFLWETRETLAEMQRFVRAVRPDLLTLHYAHPYPGTRYYEDVRAAGLRLESLHAQSEPALASPALAPGELERTARRLLLRHYGRPCVLASLARKGARLAVDRLR